MPLFTPISQDRLNICNKTRSNPLAWRGQFSPELVEVFLNDYAHHGDVIFDPFVGSGTVLYECAGQGLVGLGCEINPAAAILASLYELANLSRPERVASINAIERVLSPYLACDSSLFTHKALQPPELQKALLQVGPGIRDNAVRVLYDAFICQLDFFNNSTSVHLCKSVIRKLSNLVSSLPYSKEPIEVCLADARRVPLPDASVTYVITSPPYINVFNYHQQYRASIEALGWNLLAVSMAEIGSNRKNRGNRLLTVVQYCLDMCHVLHELHRLLGQSGRMTFVVGRESNVRKTAFFNGAIVERIATEAAGFKLELKQERVFRNKFGQSIYEDILHFSKAQEISASAADEKTRMIAASMLIEAKHRAPDETYSDFEAALKGVSLVKESPMFNLQAAWRGNSFKSSFANYPKGGQHEQVKAAL
jgi:hypothetical protein